METAEQVVERYIHPARIDTIGAAILEIAKDADDAHDAISFLDGLFGTDEEKIAELRKAWG